ENITSPNSGNTATNTNFEEISGDYYGESIMGYSVGVAQISITPSGQIGVYYNHGDLGSAKEYGQLVPKPNSYNSNILSYTFQKSNGGEYTISIERTTIQMIVVLNGSNWQVKASRKIDRTTLNDTAIQSN